MPRRNVPPSSDSARARKARGTRVVMKECRARANDAAQKPMRNTAAAKNTSDCARTMPVSPPSTTMPATPMVTRSPKRATAHPAGMLPHSWPTTSAAATRAATATSAPRRFAITGMRGITAPSPRANSSVGP